ncbi:hydrogenase maturation nickel metallochaperone HypA [Pelotomaculum propionicicum]|uniref:hydrogenase maturation nickel metallochaperone HypA/HybF n=1 Tax=Pelotomaculum propionicicum TaxID=258475 RepID=UPI003B77D594
MGVVIEIVQIADAKAKEEHARKAKRLVLQLGQLSALVPELVEACYPAAVTGTLLENAELKIEVIPANGLCLKCRRVFNAVEKEFRCPECGSEEWDLLSGKEIIIKEIQVW